MGSNNQESREAAEAAAHEDVERRLVDEARHMVEYLERALEAAPEDEQLRARMTQILEQALVLRDRIVQALERAHQRKHSEGETGTE